MTALLRRLEREHDAMRDMLVLLEREVERFRRGGRPDFAMMRDIVDYCRAFPDLVHHPIEDLLYEGLKARDASAEEAIGDLEGEHVRLAELTTSLHETLEALVGDVEVPRDSALALAGRFVELYRAHMSLEDRQFFPRLDASFAAADWRALEAEITARFPAAPDSTARRWGRLREIILDQAVSDDDPMPGARDN